MDEDIDAAHTPWRGIATRTRPDVESYKLWIEAEEWEAGEWKPTDSVTDAIVTLQDGTQWVATICAFGHVPTLRARCADNGECLSGKYLWASDLILIDETTRPSIDAVVRDLLAAGELQSAFREVDTDGEDE